ncbi:Uncharacterised protein [Yersinia enterocolitica]|nr:hypothetical protein FORC065_3467 [Yersinia enterocolitica]CNK88098.1 Uncharacterised protein [Yersinia enterocolitica]CRX53597.1 Uncharacterised protein [Yersinia enterocolitica]
MLQATLPTWLNRVPPEQNLSGMVDHRTTEDMRANWTDKANIADKYSCYYNSSCLLAVTSA